MILGLIFIWGKYRNIRRPAIYLVLVPYVDIKRLSKEWRSFTTQRAFWPTLHRLVIYTALSTYWLENISEVERTHLFRHINSFRYHCKSRNVMLSSVSIHLNEKKKKSRLLRPKSRRVTDWSSIVLLNAT